MAIFRKRRNKETSQIKIEPKHRNSLKDYYSIYYTENYRPKTSDTFKFLRITFETSELLAFISQEKCELTSGPWTFLLIDSILEVDKGYCFFFCLVSGEKNQYLAYIAYPVDLDRLCSGLNKLLFAFKAMPGFYTTFVWVSLINTNRTMFLGSREIVLYNIETSSVKPSTLKKNIWILSYLYFVILKFYDCIMVLLLDFHGIYYLFILVIKKYWTIVKLIFLRLLKIIKKVFKSFLFKIFFFFLLVLASLILVILTMEIYAPFILVALCLSFFFHMNSSLYSYINLINPVIAEG